MKIYFSFVPQKRPVISNEENYYTPDFQIQTQELPADVSYKEYGKVWCFEYSITPKKDVMQLVRDLSYYQTKILGQSQVEAIFAEQYEAKSWGYVVQQADDMIMVPEIIHTVETFERVTIKIPLQAFNTFAQLATQVTVMFGWVERNVEDGFVVFSKIESDNPSLGLFLTADLIANIENAGWQVINYSA